MHKNGKPINWDDLPIYPPPGEEDEYQGRVVEDRLGNRSYTLNTLVDQVINEYVAETFGRQDILAELEDAAQQIEHITEVTDYVLATEYIGLNPAEKKWLINRVHRDLFRFGTLEPYILDEEITEISISDLDEVYIRRGFGKLVRLEDFGFNHPLDIEQIFQRVLAPYGIELNEDDPFVEVGVHLAGRRLRISLIGPPIMPLYTAQIRLHPIQPLHLTDLADIVPDVARNLLEKIIAQGHGLLIAGDVNIAKTSLLGALLPSVPSDKRIGVVERAREIHQEFIIATTQLFSDATISFSDHLHNAQANVDVLFVDEIRWDEGASFWEVLTNEAIQQLVVSFRGKAHSARLHSAFMMGIRKAHQQLERQLIDHALESRLPFVAGLNMPSGASVPRLEFLGQWVTQGDGLMLEPLIEWDGATAQRTSIPTRYLLD